MSAHIIPLPTAAAEPVQQRRGPGRWPRSTNIISAYRWTFRHRQPKQPEQAPQAVMQNGLQYARDYLQTCERLYQDARSQFLLAQQRSNCEVQLVARAQTDARIHRTCILVRKNGGAA